MMEFKGYIAHVEYDETVKAFVGYVVNIQDVITFESDSVAGLEHEFQGSVEDYLDFCKELKRKPQRPLSGELRVKLEPALYRKLAIEAAAKGKSLNDYVVESLSTREPLRPPSRKGRTPTKSRSRAAA